MTFTDIFSLSDFIVRHHTAFSGHNIVHKATNTYVLRQMALMEDWFKRNIACVACNFDAELDCGEPFVYTQINIERVPDGYRYTEKVARA